MTTKALAALMAVAMLALLAAPAVQAQDYRHPRPHVYGYSGTPLERTLNRNMGMVDGLFMELDRRSSIRHGYPVNRWSPPGGYGYPFWSDSAYYGYGYANPYSYGGYDWAYNGGWNYRRHRSNDAWVALGAGALGFILGRTTAPKEKVALPPPVLGPPEAAPPTPASAGPAAADPAPACRAVRLTNEARIKVLVGKLGGENFVVEPGQAVMACLEFGDKAWRMVGETITPATICQTDGGYAVR
jgi:hypothetical protein